MLWMLVTRVVEARKHGPGAAALADLVEAVPLVQPERGIVRLDAERDLREAILLRLREQARQQLLAEALAAPRRHHGDRELGRLLVDEAVARLPLFEQAVPRRADVARIVV